MEEDSDECESIEDEKNSIISKINIKIRRISVPKFWNVIRIGNGIIRYYWRSRRRRKSWGRQ